VLQYVCVLRSNSESSFCSCIISHTLVFNDQHTDLNFSHIFGVNNLDIEIINSID